MQKKDDQNKLRYDLVPAIAYKELVNVYTIGAKKYGDRNWEKGLSWSRCIAALERHWYDWKEGKEKDHDGLMLLAKVAWYCFTLLVYSITHPELDDRVKYYKKEVDNNEGKM
ncbi:MAG: hypothetical protein A3K77_00675 [Euryarchaeota archaeon RBG_13_31_8]|nr:MAG: hypothetical protein A3K77_00675 [Euryarchaeota archaeon RBG_13_31_8]